MSNIFQDIYDTNFWGNAESVSGHGSNLEQTAYIRAALPNVFKNLKVKSILDIPCGDMYWAAKMQWPLAYIGADVVPELIAANKQKYPDADFRLLDITRDTLPRVDLVFVRDLFGHFCNADVQRSLRNIRASGSTYLLSTTFPDRDTEPTDILTGQWRPINLGRMWGLPDPLAIINEYSPHKGFEDKSLGLWKLS